MHDGCNGNFENGKQIVDKIRMMGFNTQFMPVPAIFLCYNCKKKITMTTMEYKCPYCGMVHGVTPCGAFDLSNIMAAGIDY